MNGAQSNARRILFASWHWYLDQSNGAAITTRETLLALARRGWDVKTFCGVATDFSAPPSVDEILTSSGVAVKKRFDGGVGESAFRAVSYRDSGVESVVVAPRSGSGCVGVGAVPLCRATPPPSRLSQPKRRRVAITSRSTNPCSVTRRRCSCRLDDVA